MVLQALVTGLVLALYYSLLPWVYGLAQWRLKGRLFLFLLLSTSVTFLPFLSGPQAWSSVLFLSVQFLFPVLLTAWGSWHNWSFEKIFWSAQTPLWIVLIILAFFPQFTQNLLQPLELLFKTLLKNDPSATTATLAGAVKDIGDTLTLARDSLVPAAQNLASSDSLKTGLSPQAINTAQLPLSLPQIMALLPGLVSFDSGLRFLISAWMLGVWRRIPQNTQPFYWSRLQYANWPIWLVVFGFAAVSIGLFNPQYEKVLQLALWLLLTLAPLYLARGLSVVAFHLTKGEDKKPIALPLKWLGLLLLFFFLPYLMIGAVALGVIDTWFHLRKDFKRK